MAAGFRSSPVAPGCSCRHRLRIYGAEVGVSPLKLLLPMNGCDLFQLKWSEPRRDQAAGPPLKTANAWRTHHVIGWRCLLLVWTAFYWLLFLVLLLSVSGMQKLFLPDLLSVRNAFTLLIHTSSCKHHCRSWPDVWQHVCLRACYGLRVKVFALLFTPLGEIWVCAI